MTLPTFETARDEIQGLFKTAWDANAAAAAGEVPRVVWDGLDDKAQRDPQKPYAQVFVRHLNSPQRTLGRVGQRRFERQGLVWIQLRTPKANSKGLSIASKLAIIARDAYEGVGTATGIWFRNTRIVEVGPEESDPFYRIDILSEFNYQEMK